jgi:hypothetical protein
MIKFFRKIRYDLMEKNKTGKYFKYAIGEIVLVVIGILIALSINTWNENRKNKITEQDIYCKLLEDFNLDRQNIAKLSAEADYKINVAKKILLELPKKNKDKSYLIDNYIQALRTNAFIPSKVTISDITSSGKLSLIKNNELKTNLLRYYAELDNLLFQLSLGRSKILDRAFAYENDIDFGFQFADYAIKAIGQEVLYTLPEDKWELNSDSKIYRQFQDDLVFFIVMSDREKQHFSKIMDEMQLTYRHLISLCK